MNDDPRVSAARYRVDRIAEAAGGAEPEQPARGRDRAPSHEAVGRPVETARAAFVETAIQQAMRRGDFDDLPGAGKPLEGLGDRYDPNWWIRRKIEREARKQDDDSNGS